MSNFELIKEPRLTPGFTVERILTNENPRIYRYDLINPYGIDVRQEITSDLSEAQILDRFVQLSQSIHLRDQTVVMIPPRSQIDNDRIKGRIIEKRHATNSVPPKDAIEVDKLLANIRTTDPEAQARLAKFNEPHDYVYWVDDGFADLLRVAIGQYEDRPDTNGEAKIMPLNPEVFEIDRGIIVFETPQPLNIKASNLHLDMMVNEIPVRAISWQKMSDGNVKVGDYVELKKINLNEDREMFPVDMLDIHMDAARTNRSMTVLPFDLPSYIFTFLTMLNQPGLTSSTTLKSPSIPAPKTPGNNSKKKAKRIKVPDVRVVTLRPGSVSASTHHQLNATDASTREYAHRWLVRGHWRNQPYPSLGEGMTKRIWIESYIKGPDGKPLLTTPKVTAIRG